MQPPITTLLDKPWDPTSQADRPSIFGSWKKREVGIIFLPIYLPLLLIAGLLSIPTFYVAHLLTRRKEKKFAFEMTAAGRGMTWNEFQAAIVTGEGTFVTEILSVQGPSRLWWTPEDIPALSPHKWDCGHEFGCFDPEFGPFSEWCYYNFTSPETGSARLIEVPVEQRRGLSQKLSTLRHVAIFSSRRMREKQKLAKP